MRLLLQTALLASGVAHLSAAAGDIRPILQTHCLKCHSTKEQKGELDLEASDIHKEPQVWENVLDQIEMGEMPPKKEKPLTAEEKKQLVGWVRGKLDQLAIANAGDPGPVVLRRLSNMEYTYTIRDLTGIESLDPAREFPVDGAAGEGFTNAGAALVMSPALLTKYFDAAKDIAKHAVLTTEGIRFSASTSSRDWTDETLAKIRGFYARFTENGGGTAVNLQGIKFDTNAGGHLPVEKFVTTLLRERDALRDGRKTIAVAAHEHGLNAKYLTTLWQALHDSKPSVLLDDLRRKFNAAAPGDAAAVIAAIQDWQQSLWRFASVGHIGKKNGPTGWQEPVTPLGPQHAIRVKLTMPEGRSDVTLYLTTNSVGDGSGQDCILWEDARIVAKDREEVMLRDLPGALPANLKVPTPSVIEIKIPASQITADTEFAVTGRLAPGSRVEAAVQLHVLTTKPGSFSGLTPSKAAATLAKGAWSDNNLRSSHSAPILVNDGSAMRRHLEAAFDDFRRLFPVALCYTKIVPVDEVVTLTLFYREDDQLKRLMLDDAQSSALDRLWDELQFVSEAPLKQVDVFEQLWQFATQDAKPEAFEPMREPILRAAEAFKKRVVEVEPRQMQAVLDFAAQAWRRPLSEAEQSEVRALHQKLCGQELPHAAAVRMLLARVLVAPAFLYRGEKAATGLKAAPVNDWELATRLSYCLWSSAPDDELRALAAAGKLHDPDVLAAQTRRMLKSGKVRRLATEFGCQWLHVRDVATLDEKSERHFPAFLDLRDDMQEEVTRFFIDLIQNDRSVLALLDADHTFVNMPLAKHYGLELRNDGWQRIDGLHAMGRGGILGFAATLSKQAGASRTSPILRGNWLAEVILGDKLPVPPKGVPVLPDEAPEGLTERQLTERHSSDERCAGCHRRMDPFGYALEGFDAIGRAREADTRTVLPDGTQISGPADLRAYLLTTRREDFLRQFCRKLLGYALGRSVQLTDKPLLETMMHSDHRTGTLISLIIQSRQFREIRGAEPARQK